MASNIAICTRQGVVARGLIPAGLDTIAGIEVPREVGRRGVLRTRPIGVGLHLAEQRVATVMGDRYVTARNLTQATVKQLRHLAAGLRRVAAGAVRITSAGTAVHRGRQRPGVGTGVVGGVQIVDPSFSTKPIHGAGIKAAGDEVTG